MTYSGLKELIELKLEQQLAALTRADLESFELRDVCDSLADFVRDDREAYPMPEDIMELQVIANCCDPPDVWETRVDDDYDDYYTPRLMLRAALWQRIIDDLAPTWDPHLAEARRSLLSKETL